MSNLKCDKIECILDRVEYCKAANSDDEKFSNDEEFSFIHCEKEGCHNNYWKAKNGQTCSECEIELCEGCAYEGRNPLEELYDSDDYTDEYLCPECYTIKNEQTKEDRKALKKKLQIAAIKERQEKKKALLGQKREGDTLSSPSSDTKRQKTDCLLNK